MQMITIQVELKPETISLDILALASLFLLDLVKLWRLLRRWRWSSRFARRCGRCWRLSCRCCCCFARLAGLGSGGRCRLVSKLKTIICWRFITRRYWFRCLAGFAAAAGLLRRDSGGRSRFGGDRRATRRSFGLSTRGRIITEFVILIIVVLLGGRFLAARSSLTVLAGIFLRLIVFDVILVFFRRRLFGCRRRTEAKEAEETLWEKLKKKKKNHTHIRVKRYSNIEQDVKALTPEFALAVNHKISTKKYKR